MVLNLVIFKDVGLKGRSEVADTSPSVVRHGNVLPMGYKVHTGSNMSAQYRLHDSSVMVPQWLCDGSVANLPLLVTISKLQ